jgi:hypothetical protein
MVNTDAVQWLSEHWKVPRKFRDAWCRTPRQLQDHRESSAFQHFRRCNTSDKCPNPGCSWSLHWAVIHADCATQLPFIRAGITRAVPLRAELSSVRYIGDADGKSSGATGQFRQCLPDGRWCKWILVRTRWLHNVFSRLVPFGTTYLGW